jgi:hypothetical protein
VRREREREKKKIMPVIVSQYYVAADLENVFLPGWSLEVIIDIMGIRYDSFA